LKILSRITEPSAGMVDIYGRVGALIEVGTGFHMELTGRENVFLNGAILGMKRQEIETQFDAIVDFAGVEKFIDTPLKHYSTGMKLRLGFAVAAHLEPEILIVDEVLAVGDAAFQRKCLGKMENVAESGRTVLFVSHNMSAVASLTQRSILLEGGRVISIGETADVIHQYIGAQEHQEQSDGYVDLRDVRREGKQLSDSPAQFAWIKILDSQRQPRERFFENEPIAFEVGVHTQKDLEIIQLGLGIGTFMERGQLFTIPSPEFGPLQANADYVFRIDVDPNYLLSGEYTVAVKLFGDGRRLDTLGRAAQLSIDPSPNGDVSVAYGKKWASGYFHFDYPWQQIDT
ncbi:MAG: Wzt carbohydrate-binding domain-containing protein, partial [Anaerolineae bacterium]|nr:Wzt carbohydrate-binding domain-containing protein [Anaerolineae bacterium]